jgi:hypothetical protein
MAKRIFTHAPTTPGWTATAAGSLATASKIMAIKGGSTTQLVDVLEILVSGQASASTVGGHAFCRASALETGAVTALAWPASDGGMNPNITALVSGSPTVTFIVSATNPPTPSNTATDAHLQLGTNLFGGIIRWNAAPFQQWQIVGNAATLGESVLVNLTDYNGVNGLATAHIMYEPT